jgi:hypothetical protein
MRPSRCGCSRRSAKRSGGRSRGDWPTWALEGRSRRTRIGGPGCCSPGAASARPRRGRNGWRLRAGHPGRRSPGARHGGGSARVMIEGRSGLLAVARAEEREEMRWEPSGGGWLCERGASLRLFGGEPGEPAGARASYRLVRRARQMAGAGKAWRICGWGCGWATKPRALVDADSAGAGGAEEYPCGAGDGHERGREQGESPICRRTSSRRWRRRIRATRLRAAGAWRRADRGGGRGAVHAAS